MLIKAAECKSSRRLAVVVTATALGLAAVPARSTPVTFSGTGTDWFNRPLAAAVSFDVVNNNNLQVILTNTSLSDVFEPSQVLTAVFFDLLGVPLTPVSAQLTDGSQVFYDRDGQPPQGNVGGEWAYNSSCLLEFLGYRGIGSSGLGLGTLLFGNPNFNGANLAGPVIVDGLQYGLLSAGDRSETGDFLLIRGSGGLIQNSVVFTLSGLPTGFDPFQSINRVIFQYGTTLLAPRFSGTRVSVSASEINAQAAPKALALLAGGLLLVTERHRRLRKPVAR